MRGWFIVVTLVLGSASAAAAAPSSGDTKRIADAAAVIRELRSAPDNGIPDSIWDKAHCVAIMPGVKKAAFVLGGEFGKGVVSCRTSNGWSAPVFLNLEKGSVGLQFGGESTDIVLLIMNERGIDKLMQNKVTLGGDMSLAAGPVGRTGAAATDAQLTAEILSYSHARGVFAGIDLSGGALRPDTKENMAFYGRDVSTYDVLSGRSMTTAPVSAQPLIAALTGGAPGHTGKHGA